MPIILVYYRNSDLSSERIPSTLEKSCQATTKTSVTFICPKDEFQC